MTSIYEIAMGSDFKRLHPKIQDRFGFCTADGKFATGRGIMVAALTTILGFGTLMLSTQPGLAGLGFCLALGVACCMTTALVFLPAILQTRRARTKVKTTQEEPEHYRLAA